MLDRSLLDRSFIGRAWRQLQGASFRSYGEIEKAIGHSDSTPGERISTTVLDRIFKTMREGGDVYDERYHGNTPLNVFLNFYDVGKGSYASVMDLLYADTHWTMKTLFSQEKLEATNLWKFFQNLPDDFTIPVDFLLGALPYKSQFDLERSGATEAKEYRRVEFKPGGRMFEILCEVFFKHPSVLKIEPEKLERIFDSASVAMRYRMSPELLHKIWEGASEQIQHEIEDYIIITPAEDLVEESSYSEFGPRVATNRLVLQWAQQRVPEDLATVRGGTRGHIPTEAEETLSRLLSPLDYDVEFREEMRRRAAVERSTERKREEPGNDEESPHQERERGRRTERRDRTERKQKEVVRVL